MRFARNSEKFITFYRIACGLDIFQDGGFFREINSLDNFTLDGIVQLSNIILDFKSYFPNYATVGDWENNILKFKKKRFDTLLG